MTKGGHVRTLSALAASTAVALALAACGGSDEPVAAEPPPATTSETATETETAPPATTETEPAETETQPAETETEPAETETETETETEPPATTESRFDVDVHVEVVGGERVGGRGRVEAKKGDRVRIEISVDAPQEFHLHGYELSQAATPDRPAVFRFPAELEGIFELESHVSEDVIVNLVVEP
jgi:hypothetical protein